MAQTIADPLAIFYLTGIIITLFLSSLLLNKKGKTRADYVLATWLFLLGFHLSLFYLVQSGNYIAWPFFLGLEIPLPLVHGPFLFLYTAELTGQFPRKRKWALHFLPAMVAYLALVPFLLLSPAGKIAVYQHKGAGYEGLTTSIAYAIYCSGFVYITLSLYLLKKHRKRILDQYSDTEKINLNWLRYLILGITLIWIVVLFANDTVIFAFVVVFILFVSYFGIRQVGLLNNSAGYRDIAPADGTPESIVSTTEQDDGQFPDKDEHQDDGQEKYLKSRLPQEYIDHIHAQLKNIMLDERPFTNPELTLSDLSKRLQVHSNSLSQVINLAEGKNFYDYINVFRIEAFEQLLADPKNQKYTLLSLAFECGFNSKSSFNRNFKKYRGLTPTEYQKQINPAGD